MPYVTAIDPWAGCFFYLSALWLPIESKWLQAFVKEELILFSMCRHGNHLQESCFCVFRRRLFVCLIGDTGRSRWQVAWRCKREQQSSSDIYRVTFLSFSLQCFTCCCPSFPLQTVLERVCKRIVTPSTLKKAQKATGFFKCVCLICSKKKKGKLTFLSIR